MDFNNYSNIVDDRARELERLRVMPFLMRKVYTWMALALTITAIVAYGIGNSPGLLMSLFGSKMPMLVLFAAEIGLVIWLSARLDPYGYRGLHRLLHPQWYDDERLLRRLYYGFHSPDLLCLGRYVWRHGLDWLYDQEGLVLDRWFPDHGAYRPDHCRTGQYVPSQHDVRPHH